MEPSSSTSIVMRHGKALFLSKISWFENGCIHKLSTESNGHRTGRIPRSGNSSILLGTWILTSKSRVTELIW
ncbi:hypothetical protein GE061_001075 [Apolygus lucorum]|uniref:Uncharacterized protein n=1 Tax=Apolygus lucorum TaxID=248454 RepID=A0A8S9Y8G3_APOLU|nr:hypothetical protein GE061_001075 [Apolygus lucorum]